MKAMSTKALASSRVSIFVAFTWLGTGTAEARGGPWRGGTAEILGFLLILLLFWLILRYRALIETAVGLLAGVSLVSSVLVLALLILKWIVTYIESWLV